ncbi:MAG: integrase core domain-containing protein, partial [Pseudomonadota bacterium]|nr:integrase core domain-containing protein [Pseudomonadota bacterium]
LPKRPKGAPRGDQRWLTFVRNHAQALVACDFCVAVTATFQLLYVFLVMEHGSRRVLHANVTRHPTAHWTRQQLREAIPSDYAYRDLIHDRDSIFSAELDSSVANLRLKVLRTPYRVPQANAYCERLIGSMRRERLDFVIPMGEGHLRRVLKDWATHYNSARPHMSLGPGVPDPPAGIPVVLKSTRHRIRDGQEIIARPVLGGLHHEYGLAAA